MKNQKWLAKLLAVTLLGTTLVTPLSTPTHAVEAAKVMVTVTDANGVKSIENTGGYRNDVNSGNTILKGTNPRVDLSFTGTSDSNIADRYKLEYQFVNRAYTNNEITTAPQASWKEIPVAGTPNTDVLENEVGKLKRRSYDVTMLPNISQESTWNNRTNVYKYPFSSSEIVSAKTSSNSASYGSYKDFINFKNENSRRYDAGTVFMGNVSAARYPSNIKESPTTMDIKPMVPDDTIPSSYTIAGNVYSVTSFNKSNNSVSLKFASGTNSVKFDTATMYLESNNSVLYYVSGNYLYVKTKAAIAQRYYLGSLQTTTYTVNGTQLKISNNNKPYMIASTQSYAKYQEASKFWGYFKAPETRAYKLGLISDDGATGRITVNGVETYFADGFKVQGSTFISKETSVNLVKGRYYPIFLEYFNWGGDAQFQMIESKSGNGNDWQAIDYNYLYPSKSDTPGEYATTSFNGAGGMPFPTDVSDYYVLYKLTDKSNNTTTLSGCYGPFSVPGKAEMNLKMHAVTADGKEVTDIGANQEFYIEYVIEPKAIPYTSNFGSKTTLESKNLKIEDQYTSDFLITQPNETGFVKTDSTRGIEFTLNSVIYKLNATKTAYEPQIAKLTKRVKVKLNNNPDVVQITISEKEKSKITYVEPYDGGMITQFFNAGTINLMIVSSLKLSDKKGAQNIVSLERRPFNARLDFVLARTTKGEIQFDFDPLKVPVAAVRMNKIVIYKDGVKLNIKPTFVLVDGVNRLTLPPLEGKTGLEHGTYSIQFELDSAKMTDLGKPLPYNYDWIIKGMHLYDPKVNNGLTDVGASTILEQIKVTIKVVKAPKIK